MVSAAISCRRSSRRLSCSRKLSDDSIGSFLYPPNPFGFVGGGVVGGSTSSSYKRDNRKMSFFARRHSDGLVPDHHNQYHTDYGMPKKSSKRHHCHRNHSHHNNRLSKRVCFIERCINELSTIFFFCSNSSDPDNLCNLGESTNTSICNSVASSRESLASDGQLSTQRKISITSHSKSGGKIPWCACWGNGCL